jgi:MoxR-like ATPase
MTIHNQISELMTYLNAEVIGQEVLVHRMMIALLADGHLLVEGAPGLAKTRAVKALGSGIQGSFHRIQFTPDLLPADVTGTDIYHPEDGSFQFASGPIFHNLILADEVNRAPAKVQSALLEAMGEHQVTVGAYSYELPKLFLVMATQNPIEQEGTYPLPEAQLDRFMLHVNVGYPDKAASRQILQLARREAMETLTDTAHAGIEPVSQETIFAARREVLQVFLSEGVEEYILEIVETTRDPARYSEEIAPWLRWGASPRGAIAIEQAARATAWLAGRDFITPEDVRSVSADALRHRILLDYTAEAEGITTQDCIEAILNLVPTP